MKRAMVLAVMLFLMSAPAMANDTLDWLRSPGSETVAVGQDVWDFVKDTMSSPDGVSLTLLNGDALNTWALSLDKDWSIATGLTLIPKVQAAYSAGALVMSRQEGRPALRGTLGVAVQITNYKNAQLLLGVRTCPGEISDREVDLGYLGRFHFTTTVEVRHLL